MKTKKESDKTKDEETNTVDKVKEHLINMIIHKNALTSKEVDKERYLKGYETRITKFTESLAELCEKGSDAILILTIQANKSLVPMLAEQKAMEKYLSKKIAKQTDYVINRISRIPELKNETKDIETLTHKYKEIFNGVEIR